jgi:hypothetical protein
VQGLPVNDPFVAVSATVPVGGLLDVVSVTVAVQVEVALFASPFGEQATVVVVASRTLSATVPVLPVNVLATPP